MKTERAALTAEEQLALKVARARTERGEWTGPNVVAVLVGAVERLTESPVREHRYWPTEKADAEFGGHRDRR